MLRKIFGLAFLLSAVLIFLGMSYAYTAANTVKESGASDQSTGPFSANDFKPPQCAALNLTNIVTGAGKLKGTNQNDLILGSADPDTLSGISGDDCIVGGGGNDVLDGSSGNDILLGGAGDDTLDGGPQSDECYGGSEVDTFSNCETIVDP